MASTYSTGSRLELMATGENSGTWGDKANTVFQLIEDVVDGYVSVTMLDSTDALTTVNGAADEARNKVINIVGTLSANREMNVGAVEKVYIVVNNTTGGFSITFGVSGNTLVTIANGDKALIYVDGTNAYAVINAASATAKGTVELATDAEAIAASDTTRAVTLGNLAALTGANLAALVASDTVKGIAELATSAETITGTDAGRVVTPAGAAAAYQPLDSDLTSIAALSTTSYGRAFLALANQAATMALLSAASDTAQGIAELATNTETETGTDTGRVVTPAGGAATYAKLSGATFTGDVTTTQAFYTSAEADPGAGNMAAQTFVGDAFQFPATQVPSADANTLDDYEEGTFTPALALATVGTSSWGSVTAGATYEKIGRMVHIAGTYTGTLTLGTGSGLVQMTGLPFTVSGSTAWITLGLLSNTIVWGTASCTAIHGLAINGQTYLNFYGEATSRNSSTLTEADLTAGSPITLRFSGTYKV